MTRQLVMIHGRAQEKKDSRALKAEWLEALGKGLAKSNLRLPIPEHDVRLPFYGDALFDLISGAAPEHVAAVIVRGTPDHEEARFQTGIMQEACNRAGVTEEEIAQEIGIHTGTLFMLWTLIGRILSDASLFPEIGDPGQESGQLKPLEDYYPDAQEMLQVLSVMMPKNPIRASYACFLQDQATLFLIGHELAHVTLGHVAYLAKKGQGATREVGISGPQDENAILERQGIELDADGRSIMARIDSLRITYQNPDTSPIPWAPAAESPGRLIHDWAVSLGILFRIFGDERFSAASLAQSSYPPPLLRRIMCNSTALDTIVRFWSPELENIGRESLLTAQADTDRAFDTLLGISLPRTPYEGGGCLRFAPSFEKD